jgi:DNA-binding NarL/FixJ family response regulator
MVTCSSVVGTLENFMEFKAIKNTRYLVSEDGDVYSTVSDKFLKHIDDGRGYSAVTLWVDGVSEKFKVHRLVAEAFLEKPSASALEVNHKDGVKANNHYTNLEWVSHSENMTHAHKTGLMCKGSETYIAKLTEKNVEDIKHLMLAGLNNQEIAEKFLVARGTISKIRDKKTWKHVLPDLELPLTESKFKRKGLSPEEVREVRALYSAGHTLTEIGKQFNLHSGTIHAIISGKSYKNIT